MLPIRDAELRLASSQQCIQDMERQELIPVDTIWKPKLSGCMHGATLFTTTKTGVPKITFAKHYGERDVYNRPIPPDRINPLLDYAAFTILKTCGARSPVFKLKGCHENYDKKSANSIYSFATDIAQQHVKHAGRKYWYQELASNTCVINIYKNTLDIAANLIPEFMQTDGLPVNDSCVSFAVDQESAVCMLLLMIILNLRDLNSKNVGFVISLENNKYTAKLAIIDFCVNVSKVFSTRARSLDKLVRTKMQEMTCFLEIYQLADLLEEADYIKAFKKIADNFIPACEEIQAKVHDMSFATTESKASLNDDLEIWKHNFLNMQTFVAAAADQEKQPARMPRKI